ncbi:hypothetical protein [Streptomyces violaceus]|uniref:hypothetical protein n=1 Tax=Streptomyces violaceus TaxID=1936 RepID=UPI0019B3D987|nr:hypothetical protein GCM10010270_39040 [Streptomyces janthinus]
MTVLEDRIAMAESDNPRQLDELFERLEKRRGRGRAAVCPAGGEPGVHGDVEAR